jgi:mannosyltransferase OCH1-like enzyme
MSAFEIDYPDFKASILRETVGSSEEIAKRKKAYEEFNQEYIEMFRKAYERNIAEAKNSPSETYRIPRIVHQIWLGNALPEKYKEWMRTWMELSGWEYKLWTDEDVEGFKMYNRDLFDKTSNYGEKSDIWRLEILYRYGGVYADTDYECLRPEIFEALHRNFDFYVGFEPMEHGKINKYNIFKVCNAMMGSIPKHPLVGDMVINLKASCLAYKTFGVVERTGPAYYTRMMCQYIANEYPNYRTVFLPCSFFYLFMERELIDLHLSPGGLSLLPETAGIHYWSSSWR